MNTINEIIKLVFATLSFLYFIIQLSFLKFWQKRIMSKLDDLILKTSSQKNIKSIIVLILCPLLILFSLLTKSTTFVCCLMCVISALACFIVCKELVYSKLNGIYKNGIIGESRFFEFKKISSFPDTNWKEPEKQETLQLAIQQIQEKNKKEEITFITYSSITEYSKVVFALKELKLAK